MKTYIVTAVTHCTYVVEAETPEDAVWTFASNDPMATTETFTVYNDYGNELYQEVTNDNRRV
jgi:hypothetical protein